jgi:membrane protease YdiL (CAAX protease family)
LNNLEIILLGYIFLYPVLDLVNEKYKSNNKNIEYLKIAFSLWLPTSLLVYLFYTQQLSVTKFDYLIENNWQNITLISLIAIAIIYVIALIKSLQTNEKLKKEIASKFKSYIGMMPVTKSQILIFTLIVSVSAGICEELIFRAYLYTLIDSSLGMPAAIVLSSIVFGLWHIYLGWQDVIRTSIMGVLLCGAFIFTGNIIIPIILHIFIDVYSGLICYYSMQKTPMTNDEK